MLLTTTARDRAGEGVAASELRNALASGRIEEIVWNHSFVSTVVPLLGSGQLPGTVGTHGVPGAYRFTGLTILARRFPEESFVALAPLLEGG